MTGLTASPASAGSASVDFLTCNPLAEEGDGVFGGVSSLVARGEAARGQGGGEPVLDVVHEDLPASAQNVAGPGFSVTIPVHFHVVHDGPIGKVSRSDIDKQISVLNRTYSGREGGSVTGFSFELVSVDYTNNAKWFYANPGGAEFEMKKALHRGDAGDLNYYSTTAGAYLGWAYLPSDYAARPWIDGVVVNWESMVRTSSTFKGRYDQGKTATHEVGHWLNLEHVFYGGCNNWGDYVDDTPPQKVATRGCPVGQDSCSEPGLDSIHNYMDYSYDACYNQFTEGQTQRMQDSWLFYRAG